MGKGIGLFLLDLSTAGITANIRGKRRARKARQRQVALENRRARTQQVREARIRRGIITNLGRQAGAVTSSAISGAAGIVSQLGSNLSFLDEQFAIQKSLFSAERLINRGQTIKAVNDLFAQAAGQGG